MPEQMWDSLLRLTEDRVRPNREQARSHRTCADPVGASLSGASDDSGLTAPTEHRQAVSE